MTGSFGSIFLVATLLSADAHAVSFGRCAHPFSPIKHRQIEREAKKRNVLWRRVLRAFKPKPKNFKLKVNGSRILMKPNREKREHGGTKIDFESQDKIKSVLRLLKRLEIIDLSSVKHEVEHQHGYWKDEYYQIRLGKVGKELREPLIELIKEAQLGDPYSDRFFRAAVELVHLPGSHFEQMRSKGFYGRSRAKHDEIVARYELEPSYEITINGTRVRFSPQFTHKYEGGKKSYEDFVLVDVEIDGVWHRRMYFKSARHGGFRLIPAQGPGHINKSFSEDALTMPIELEYSIETTFPRAKVISAHDWQKLMDVTVHRLYYDLKIEKKIWLNHPDHLVHHVSLSPLLESRTRKKIKRTGYEEFRHHTPEDIVVPTELSPNFKAGPSYSFEKSTRFLGRVMTYIYTSNNGELQWVFYRVLEGKHQGKAWVGSVQSIDAGLTSHGVREKAFAAEELLMAMRMRTSELATTYQASRQSPDMEHGYATAWNFIREIEVIKDFYESIGETVPARSENP